MTFRAVILGLLGTVLICGLTYMNDTIMHQSALVGNSFPIGVYGVLLVFVLTLNPLLHRLHPTLALRGPELAVILFITLVSCCLPGSGLMRHFSRDLILPHHYARTEPGWQKLDILHQVPDYMLVKITPENENTVLNAFVQPEMRQDETLLDKVKRVPWLAWLPTFLFWFPFIILFLVAMVGLSAVTHRQWADHEQLPYPIVQFVQSLLPGENNVVMSVLRNKLFWYAALGVFLIHLNNNLAVLPSLSKYMIKIPLSANFSALGQVFPVIIKGGGAQFFTPNFVFSVFGIAFLLATDVSLAVGLAFPLWCIVVGMFAGYGISLRGGVDPDPSTMLSFGAYLGIFLVILYIGRTYYLDVFLRALFLREQGTGKQYPESILGARIFLAAITIFIIYASVLAHMDWLLVTIYTFGMVLIYVVLGRIIAETGYFIISPAFAPTAILTGLIGLVGVGPEFILKAGLFTKALLVDPRETLTPFLANSYKLLDLQKVKIQQVLHWGAVSLVIGLVVAIASTLYIQYNIGRSLEDTWAGHWAVVGPFYGYQGATDRLTAQDTLGLSKTISDSPNSLLRFAYLNPQPKGMIAFGIGLALVLLCTVGRLRISKWPLHPIFFLIWNAWPAPHFTASFLLAWMAKVSVMRYGGAHIYLLLRPIAFGLIGGEMIAGLLNILFGAIYYLVTKEFPPSYGVMLQ